MPALVLGPMLRYLDSTSATIWVETDAPCTVYVWVRDAPPASAPTFCVGGHHYAIVALRGLTPGATVPYSVELDDDLVWPEEGSAFAASVLRPYEPGRPLRIAFGSCRAAAPLDDEKFGVDALHALAERMQRSAPEDWPDLLALVGDQVYADDNLSPQTLRYIAAKRGPDDGPGHEVANLDEYLQLYAESWSLAPIRWLFSTLPTAMIFDDHDIRDDWNTSQPWRERMHATNWWAERITSGLLTYWLYQHLGNLSPDELDADPMLAALRAHSGDGEALLREYAQQADAAADGGLGVRWSYARDYGSVRLIVLDSRCNRVVDGKQRLMVNDREWAWFEAQCTGNVDHLLIVTSLPYLLPAGVHGLEAFDEAIAQGQWGKRAARVAENVRQGMDLEHWAAFETSFRRMKDAVAEVADGRRGRAPASVTFLSGDVHFSYLAEAKLAPESSSKSHVLQAVCSPIRNPLPKRLQVAERVASSGIGHAIGSFLERRGHASAPGLAWSLTRGPVFGNTLAEVLLEGRSARISVSSARTGPRLQEAWAASFTA